MRQIMAIIDKLDIRRPQVLVEAIIADVNVTSRRNWGSTGRPSARGSNVPAAGFVSPVGGTSIVDLATAVREPGQRRPPHCCKARPSASGRIGSGSVNFAAVLRAISSDAHTNVIATPSTVTMDNQEAELKVAQEVPFVTGQFSNTGTATNGAVNPFQTDPA